MCARSETLASDFVAESIPIPELLTQDCNPTTDEAGMALDRAVTSVTYDRATVIRVAHYQAERLKYGDMPGLVEMCSELVANDAARSLNATSMRNAARDMGRASGSRASPVGGTPARGA